MNKLLFVALGGAIGSSLRFFLSAIIPKVLGRIFLWGTFSVNVIGSLFIGILWAYFENNLSNYNLKLFLVVGLLGGFTTFSSFSLETINLFKTDGMRSAIIYILATNTFGILAAFGGYYLSKEIMSIS